MSGLTLIIIHIILQNKQLEMKPVKKKKKIFALNHPSLILNHVLKS